MLNDTPKTMWTPDEDSVFSKLAYLFDLRNATDLSVTHCGCSVFIHYSFTMSPLSNIGQESLNLLTVDILLTLANKVVMWITVFITYA